MKLIYPMPRGQKKTRTCRLCKCTFKGKHEHILEKDLAAIKSLENNTFKKKSNEKMIVCTKCKAGIKQSRYILDVNKRRKNSNKQQKVAAESRADNKEANRNVMQKKTLHGILDAMDESDRNSV